MENNRTIPVQGLIGPAHPNYKSGRLVVGLSGYARAGKDTVVDLLSQDHGFTRFAFADYLRECVLTLNPIVGTNSKSESVYFSDIIDVWGWDGYKETPYGSEMRRLLQRMGTEVGRNLINDNLWTDRLDSVSSNTVAVSDVRFPNEAEKIKSLGGVMIRVIRPGVQPANPHFSEVALDGYPFDYVIINDGSLEDLKTKVDLIYNSLISWYNMKHD